MNDQNMQIIENATRAAVRPGDHVVWEQTQRPDGATITERREGIAHHRDSFGDWCTERGARLTSLHGTGITITIRRPVRELPTEPGTVIVPADGQERIEAASCGTAYFAREAALIGGLWRAVWRTATGVVSLLPMAPEEIATGTWKVEDR